VGKLRRLAEVLEELPLAVHTPALERRWVDAHYAAQARYRSPTNQHAGLFPFEARALDAYFPSPPARLFVPGAGAGRELLALIGRGHTVEGLEPEPTLRQAAERLLSPLRPESIQEWARSPEGQFAGVFAGWGLWAHLTAQRDRTAVLQAFRNVCPKGPVLLSFFRRSPLYEASERMAPPLPLCPAPEGRLQSLTRGWLRQRLLGLPPLERGVGWSRGFYFHAMSEAELVEEANASGYQVKYFEQDLSRYPHAVLTPRAQSGRKRRGA
jgi:hypothetical protein